MQSETDPEEVNKTSQSKVKTFDKRYLKGVGSLPYLPKVNFSSKFRALQSIVDSINSLQDE